MRQINNHEPIIKDLNTPQPHVHDPLTRMGGNYLDGYSPPGSRSIASTACEVNAVDAGLDGDTRVFIGDFALMFKASLEGVTLSVLPQRQRTDWDGAVCRTPACAPGGPGSVHGARAA